MTEPGAGPALYDIVIIGGGIIGCGIARDAALRGLKVALVEKHDFGSGTTAGSTRLIHGGLRYLEHADFALVRLDLRERETLLRIAPHLVKPLPFLLPLPKGLYGRTRLRIGMHLYDAFSYDKTLPRHRILSPDDLHHLEPGLDTSRFHGAAMFYDCQCASPERLTIENAIDASGRGALIQNYTEVVGAIHDGVRLAGVRVRNVLTGEESELRGSQRGQRQRPVVRPCRRPNRIGAATAPPHHEGRPHRLRALHQPRDLPGVRGRRPRRLRHPLDGPHLDWHDRHRLRRRSRDGVRDGRRRPLPDRVGGTAAAGGPDGEEILDLRRRAGAGAVGWFAVRREPHAPDHDGPVWPRIHHRQQADRLPRHRRGRGRHRRPPARTRCALHDELGQAARRQRRAGRARRRRPRRPRHNRRPAPVVSEAGGLRVPTERPRISTGPGGRVDGHNSHVMQQALDWSEARRLEEVAACTVRMAHDRRPLGSIRRTDS